MADNDVLRRDGVLVRITGTHRIFLIQIYLEAGHAVERRKGAVNRAGAAPAIHALNGDNFVGHFTLSLKPFFEFLFYGLIDFDRLKFDFIFFSVLYQSILLLI